MLSGKLWNKTPFLIAGLTLLRSLNSIILPVDFGNVLNTDNVCAGDSR